MSGVEEIDSDQWTVYGQFHAHRPLHKVSTDSVDGDVVYVSGTTGEVLQDTHGRERFWNWLGAVPHWLYFKALRERHSLWYNLMVWSSALGTILVAAGLYLGIKRTLRAGDRWTRYLGPMRWHHITGLVFGLVTLTWILSGLLSLNPWGLLEGGSGGDRSYAEPDWLAADDIDRVLLQARNDIGPTIVNMTITARRGAPSVIMIDETGGRVRLNGTDLSVDSATQDEVLATLADMRPDVLTQSLELLHDEDAYYFGHKERIRLPVYRAILDDAEATRYYFDATTGEFLQRTGRTRKWYRWLHHGLHRLDFTAWLRSRPLWDVVMLPLLLGVTLLCFFGCRVAYRRLRHF